VSLGVWLLRKNNPELARPFKTPLVPLVPILGVLVCGGMIISLDQATLKVALVWMVIGILIYFGYGIRKSHLQKKN
jgi:APA family basic amino acid/polyamine antiporter